MKTKQFNRVEIKDAEQGLVEAVFATFNVIDHDGDVTLPGAFTDGAPVRVSAYGHRSWDGVLPVGKGSIRQTKTEAIADLQFFMNIPTARDTFLVVKEMADLQEWSYGFDYDDVGPGEVDGQRVQLLRKLTVHEVSPVLLGAGIGTRTLNVKGKQLNSDLRQQLSGLGREKFGAEDTWVWLRDFDMDESYAIFEVEGDDSYALMQVSFTRADGAITLGDDAAEVVPVTNYTAKQGTPKRFSEHATSVLAGVTALTGRATEVMALRALKGKALSTESTELLGSIERELKRLEELLRAPQSTDHEDEAMREYLRFVKINQGVA